MRELLLVGVLAASLTVVGVLRHANYWSEFDLAVFDQGVWQLSRGRTYVSLIDRNIFADHFSPVLVLFAPLYRIVATPVWLIVAQSLALAATLIPMRRLADELRAPRWLATVLVIGSGPLLAAGVFDFHASTLAVPFVAVALLGAVRDQPTQAMVGGALVIFSRADLAWVLVGVAVVAGRRARWRMLSTAAVGVGLGLAVPRLLGATGSFETHYGHIGTDPVEALLNPWRIVEAFFDSGSFRALVTWLLAVTFLPLLRPRWFLALIAASLPVLLSQWEGTHLPWHHYGAPYVPVAVGGAMAGFVWLRDHPTPLISERRLRAVPVAGALACLLVASPLAPTAPRPQQVWWTLFPAPGDRGAAVAAVGDGAASVAYHLAPHLSQREELYLHPLPFDPLPATLPPELAPRPDADAASGVRFIAVRRGEVDGLPDGFEIELETERYQVLRRRLPTG